MNNTLKNVLKKGNKKKDRDIQKYKNYFKSINHEKAKLDALKEITKVTNQLMNGFVNEKESKNIDPEVVAHIKKTNYGLDCDIKIPDILNGFVNENDYTNKNYDGDNDEHLKNTKFNIDVDIKIPNLLNGIENEYYAGDNEEKSTQNYYGLDCEINVPEILIQFVNEKDYVTKSAREYNINDVYSRNIKTVYNIYQESYKHNVKSTGFGDFIRGCYFILHFCETFKLECKIIINHSLKKFLKNGIQLPVNLSNVTLFTNNNCDGHSTDSNGVIHNIIGNKINSTIISYLVNDVPVIKESVFISNIVYPNHIIDKKHKIQMRYLLEPIDQMNNQIQCALRNLNLTKDIFCVIQIRCGDKYLKDLALQIDNDDYIKRLTTEIFMLIKSNNFSSYLLIADNIEIKRVIAKLFPSIKVLFNEITHFGEGIIQEDIKVQNTLLEFYLMSYSSHIFSFSSYKHGSGFSQWCAETYDIPYVCKLIQ